MSRPVYALYALNRTLRGSQTWSRRFGEEIIRHFRESADWRLHCIGLVTLPQNLTISVAGVPSASHVLSRMPHVITVCGKFKKKILLLDLPAVA